MANKTGGLYFDGVDDYIILNNSDLFQGIGKGGTFSAWVKIPNKSGLNRDIIWATNNTFILKFIDNKFKTWMQTYDTVTGYITHNTVIQFNKWLHVVLKYSPDDSKTYLYVNGIADTITGNLTGVLKSFNTCRIGANYANSNDFFNGIIKDVRIYNRALSDEEISNLYQGKPVSSEGLVLHLPMNENKGSIVFDKSGYNNHGTIYGAKWVNKSTGGLYFDGKDDYVDCGNDSSLDITDEITLSAWVRTEGGGGIIGRKRFTSSLTGYRLFILNNKIYLQWADGTTSTSAYAGSLTWLNSNWYHIVATFNSGEYNIYRDSVSLVSDTSSVTNIDSGTEKLGIGTVTGNLSYTPFEGIIKDVRIYNRALTDTEIQQLYRGRDIREGLVLHLPMNENEGSTVYDTSGYGNHGTIYGAKWVNRKVK